MKRNATVRLLFLSVFAAIAFVDSISPSPIDHAPLISRGISIGLPFSFIFGGILIYLTRKRSDELLIASMLSVLLILISIPIFMKFWNGYLDVSEPRNVEVEILDARLGSFKGDTWCATRVKDKTQSLVDLRLESDDCTKLKRGLILNLVLKEGRLGYQWLKSYQISPEIK